MAYVVRRPNHSWEIRESRLTEAGPRARTLATFRELTPEVLERVRRRASQPFDEQELLRSAARVAAPVVSSRVDRTARELLAQLASGERPTPVLRRLLVQALRARDGDGAGVPDHLRWIGADPRARGDALHDLLLLADALPPPRRSPRLRFPPLARGAA